MSPLFQRAQPTRAIIGLGNVGAAYEGTRHNAGFMALDALAARLDIRVDKKKMNGLIGEGRLGDQRLVLVKPTTFMNLSGDCVQQVMRWYKLKMEDILVFVDDIDLPVGALRLRKQGGAGTHNGLKSLIQCLGGQDFARLRLGIGAPPPGRDLADYVLGRFDKGEQTLLAPVYDRAADGALIWLKEGVDRAMNRINAGVITHEG